MEYLVQKNSLLILKTLKKKKKKKKMNASSFLLLFFWVGTFLDSMVHLANFPKQNGTPYRKVFEMQVSSLKQHTQNVIY